MKTKILRKSFALSLAAAIATLPNSVLAQSAVVTKENVSPNSTAAYWTAERMRSAKSLDLPKAKANSTPAPAPTATQPPVIGEGKPPTVNVAPNTQKLFTPTAADDLVQPSDVGSFGAHFTSSRLVPLSADRTYPYRTVGKLFFTKPGGGNFVCSASVLRPRVILTAGHCVHSGNGSSNGFYSNFLFVPAFRDGVAPYQRWNWAYVVVSRSWFSGGGGVPNTADYAMLEATDNIVNGSVRRIGDVVGYLGYRTQSLIPNHSTLLGYPCNLDSCAKMHQVTAGSFRSVAPNNAEYGSDMTGGSSGGPWVQNFGVTATGQTGGLNSGRNQVVGVTSYGYISSSPLVQGSSILNQQFLDVLNATCSHRSGNC